MSPIEALEKVVKTPWVDNCLSDEEKRVRITHNFREIMATLGLNLNDDSLRDTPNRVAKMFVDEIFYGLNPKNLPKITCVENKMNYTGIVLEANITMNSHCEHHFVTILGRAHIAYIPKKKVIGLSKLNRIVSYFAARPQIQERLTMQIQQFLVNILETENVAVVVDAVHACVKTRGIKDSSSATRTSFLSGVFKNEESARAEFYNSIPKLNELRLD